MKYSKKIIGEELKAKLLTGDNIENISNWTLYLYFNSRSKLSTDIDETLGKIYIMDAGPEFELTISELNEIANKLIIEGEKEELFQPIPEIKEKAIQLDEVWMMCPLCQHVWETQSKYGMLQCPGCNNKLHNPKFDPT
jgi:hypothetical protein